MKLLYLNCAMGAAGDMLLGALSELTDNPPDFIEKLNRLGLPGVAVAREPAVSGGIAGVHIRVSAHGQEEGEPKDGHGQHAGQEHDSEHEHRHHGRSLEDISRIIDGMPVSESVKGQVKAVYGLVAQAESAAHGKPVGEIHFHELGMLDALVDITGCVLAMEQIRPDRIVCSTVSLGGGTVKTAHGVLPVPAPATAALLSGMPVAGGPVEEELTTPTGAALLRYFVQEFGLMPPMRMQKTAYGTGSKVFDRPNCVRAMLGEAEGKSLERIVELSCNLDDMTGEALAFAMERLMEAGALDAFVTPILMKKGRPAHQLTVLCREGEEEILADVLLRHTTTLGVRRSMKERYTLARREEQKQTSYGPVRIKIADGEGVHKVKPEYEDVARIARERELPIKDVLEEILK